MPPILLCVPSGNQARLDRLHVTDATLTARDPSLPPTPRSQDGRSSDEEDDTRVRLPGGTPYRVEEHPVDSARSNPGGPPPLRSRVAFASEGADSAPGPNDRLDRDYVSSKPIEDAKEKEQEVKKGVNRKSLAERFSHMQVAGTEDAMARHAEKRFAAQSERFRKKKRGDEGYNSDDDGTFYDWELYDKKKSVGAARNAWDKDGNPLAVIKGRRLTLAERLDSGGIIEPDGEFSRQWDVITAVLLVFVAVVTPFELGFLTTRIDTTPSLILFAINRVVDFLFIVDIVIQANTAFIDTRGRKVYSRRKIFWHYARTWMFVDVVSVIPYDTINVILSEGNSDPDDSSFKAVRIIRLLRLLKLLRILRGMRIFKRWEARLTLNYAMLSLQKYFLTLLLAAHWIGCTLFLVHHILELDCRDDPNKIDTCTFLYYYMDGKLVNADPAGKYLLSVYFATGELMGTPFGDLIPVRPEERLYFTICHLTAGFVNAYLVGGMVAAITALNARNQGFYNSMDTLNRFLKEKRLNARNPRLCERLRSYYIFRHHEGDGDGWKDIVHRTSREMQGEIVQELHSDWLRRVHYFSGVDVDGNEWEVDDEFKLQLSLSMSVEVVAPMETVFKEDSPIDQLFVIQQGVVGCKGRVLKKGDPFGEDVLVYYSPEVLDEQEFRMRYGARWVCRPNGRGYRATAMTNVLLLAFPGDAIHELLDRPKYEYVKHQVRRKMFVWQVRHVMLMMYRALREAVAADTYADGMQVLLQQYGFEMMQNVPTINERYMIMREAKGDDEVKVMRLFRKMWNRKRFIAAVEGLVRKRRRERALVEVRDELRANVLKPVGAESYANALVAQGVTTRTVRDFSAMELVTSGLTVVLAKRVYKAARNLPEPDVSYIGADGVAVDSRYVAGKGCVAELERLDAEAKKKKRELMRSLLYAEESDDDDDDDDDDDGESPPAPPQMPPPAVPGGPMHGGRSLLAQMNRRGGSGSGSGRSTPRSISRSASSNQLYGPAG